MIIPGECSNIFAEIIKPSSEVLITGETVDFKSVCYDKYNNRITTGGAEFSCVVLVKDNAGLITDTSITNKIKDNKDGTYTFKFTPIYAGNYFASISLGQNVFGD